MELDAIAANATAMKAVQVQSDVSMAVARKAMEMQKADGEQTMQLLDRATGAGSKVNLIA
jgi:hypothetical protein